MYTREGRRSRLVCRDRADCALRAEASPGLLRELEVRSAAEVWRQCEAARLSIRHRRRDLGPDAELLGELFTMPTGQPVKGQQVDLRPPGMVVGADHG